MVSLFRRPIRIDFRSRTTGAFAQYEKARLVGKLRAARDRKSETKGKRIEGRGGFAKHQPAIYDALRDIKASQPGATLRVIADELAACGFVSKSGKTHAANQITRLLSRL